MPESKKHGLIIAIDGPDGVGKSTQVKLLHEYLQSLGKPVYTTRHSGGTPIGEELRKVSLSEYDRPAETDLFISLAMGAALAEVVQKRKASGEVIVIDRSPLAIVAYNGFGSELPNKKLAFDACEALFKRLQIDLLIYLSASQSLLNDRRNQRGTLDHFESLGPEFHARVHEGYMAGLEFLQNHPELGTKVVSIDAAGKIDSIHNSIIKQVSKPLFWKLRH